jgi:hypothetical protein
MIYIIDIHLIGLKIAHFIVIIIIVIIIVIIVIIIIPIIINNIIIIITITTIIIIIIIKIMNSIVATVLDTIIPIPDTMIMIMFG